MDWFRVDSGLSEHYKARALARKLGVPLAHALGLVVSLWAFAAQSREDGDLTGIGPAALLHRRTGK